MSVYEVIEKISRECHKHWDCDECPFDAKNTPLDCNITLLAEQLSRSIPCTWDLGKIKEILDD